MEFIAILLFATFVWVVLTLATKRPWLRVTLLFVIVGGIVAAAVIPCMLPSRMAANESAAIGDCKTFVMAEETYHREDHNGDKVLEYAMSLQQLYGSGTINLVDRAFASAEGSKGTPKAGYFFKVLTAQGPGGPGGKKSFLNKDGRLKEGYALVAWPASWDQSGRNTFQVSQSGTIYQRDLGGMTQQIAEGMTEFDPQFGGMTWIAAE